MKVPDYWGVVGFPITHSLTPKIFQIVGEHMGFESIKIVFIKAKNIVAEESEKLKILEVTCTKLHDVVLFLLVFSCLFFWF